MGTVGWALGWKCFRVIWSHHKEVFYSSSWFFGSNKWNEGWIGHHSCSLSSLFPFTKAVSQGASQSPNYCQQHLSFARKIKRWTMNSFSKSGLTQCEAQRRTWPAKLKERRGVWWTYFWSKVPIFYFCLGWPYAQTPYEGLGRTCKRFTSGSVTSLLAKKPANYPLLEL